MIILTRKPPEDNKMDEIKNIDFNSSSPKQDEAKKGHQRVNFNMDGFNTYEITEAFKTLKVNLFFCLDLFET